jgi:hypothetical protein
MIRNSFLTLYLSCFLTVFCSVAAYAQPVLPDVMAVSQNGVNVLSWTNQYDGIKSIAVQRSSDSVYNFATIGYVKNLKKGAQAFIDGHPNPGNNWYRLYIVFSSDLTWFSNRARLFVDSAQLMKKGVLPPNDSLQKMVNTLSLSNGTVPDPSEINAYTYIRSQYVFTNPFTGHVNVELPDSTDKKSTFSLVFFDGKNKQVLEVPKISEHNVIIDKRNFQRKGIYKFEMRRNRDLLETGYITIY